MDTSGKIDAKTVGRVATTRQDGVRRVKEKSAPGHYNMAVGQNGHARPGADKGIRRARLARLQGVVNVADHNRPESRR